VICIVLVDVHNILICIDYLLLTVLLILCRVTKEFLSKDPFNDFLTSMYFKRYLQWKWLERYTYIVLNLKAQLSMSRLVFNV